MSNHSLYSYFFGSLPEYFYHNDSYQESGQGLLQRLLGSIQETLEEFVSLIGNTDGTSGLHLLKDINEVPEEYLAYMGYLFGNPPVVIQGPSYTRSLLREAITLYKQRGKEESLERFFSLFGVTVSITPEVLDNIGYDQSDYDDITVNYDTGCIYCVRYALTIHDPNGRISQFMQSPPPDGWEQSFNQVLEFLLPIHMVNTDIVYNGPNLE